MSHQNSDQPSSFQPSGNRPAQNARQGTPGSTTQNQFPGDGQGADFLGLGDEVEPTAPSELMQPLVEDTHPADAPEEQLGQEAQQDQDEGADELEEEFYEEEGGVHTSWVEEPGPVRSRGMLPKVLIAMVLGMGGMTAVFVLQQERQAPEQATPLAPEMNTTPGFEQRILEGAPLEATGRGRTPVTKGPGARPAGGGGAGAVALVEPAPAGDVGAPVAEVAPADPTAVAADGSTEPAADGQRAAAAALIPAWQRIGETYPPGVQAQLLAASEPAPAGAQPEPEPLEPGGESVAGIGGGSEAGLTTFVVVGDDTGFPEIEEHAYWDEVAALEESAEAVTWSGDWSEEAEPAALEPAPEEAAEVVTWSGDWSEEAEPAALEPAPEEAAEVVTWSGDWSEEAEPAALEPAPEEVAEIVTSLEGWSDETTEVALEPVLDETAEAALEPVLDESAEVALEPVLDESAEVALEPVLDESAEVALEPVLDESAEVALEPVPDETAVVALEPVAVPDPALDSGPLELAAAEVEPTAPAPGAGVFGPALPAGVEAPVVAQRLGEDELPVNTRVRRIESSQVVEPDQRGPRLATEEELKGVWLKEEVPPMRAIEQQKRVLTPQVGQVRVVLEGNEIFQGRLYAMGEGRVWINNPKFGQMGLDGSKVEKILRIVADENSPLPGQGGSQNLGGLETVRIKTASGGVLVGKIIARDELRTTLVTKDGTSVTFASDQFEFLDEAPTVSLKRAKPPADQPAGGKTPDAAGTDEPVKKPR